jgi:hypothetical protein
MHLRSVLFTSAAAAALYCTPSRQQPKPGVVCTLLGCSNGVIVHLAARPTTTFRVELIPAHGTDGTRYALNANEPMSVQKTSCSPTSLPSRLEL